MEPLKTYSFGKFEKQKLRQHRKNLPTEQTL